MLNDICIFDFETSGLNARGEQVIEMAALRVINGEIVTEFDTLVSLEGRELAPKITEITGITPAMLERAMPEEIASKILRNIMGSSLLVAHNAAFDLQFLHWAMQRIGNKTFDNNFIDTMTICRDRYTYRSKEEGHKLQGMCDRLGIELTGAHRALNDVRATYDLLMALHLEESVEPWINRLGYLSKYKAPEWTPAYADVFPTENRYEPRNAG